MARGVILGEQKPSRLQIYVPRGSEDVIVGKCLAPGCDAVFYEGQEADWQRHVARCAREKLDEIRALAPSETRKGTIFAPENYDQELVEHFKGVREQMEREGRMEIKPHEAGGL